MEASAEDLRRLAYGNPEAFPVLFDSAATGPLGRYSILAAFPEAALWSDGEGRLHGERADARPDTASPRGFLDAFDELWRASAPSADGTVCQPDGLEASGPFRGGWVVYLGYELASEIEPQLALPAARERASGPRAFALRVPAALVYDHETNRAWTIVESGREALRSRLEQALAAARGGCGSGPVPRSRALESLPLESLPLESLPREALLLEALQLQEEDPERFGTCVGAALEHIRAGDIYQANLSRAWRADFEPAGGVESLTRASALLYERLRRLNPAPFAALAQFQAWCVLSSSPERLVRVLGRRVETRPIAGTRPRSRLLDADQREMAALLAHPKERAEHIMLVDLERNDLGRICRAGSVRADELMALESYAHVHHIVSNVCGELNEGLGPVDVLRAVFPGGSITGCPKFRCMQIIAALEQATRGAYTGALGFVNHDGSMDFNILIRTITMDAHALEFRAGAGIVADSDWQLELQETRAKARGLIAALQP